MMWSVGSGKTPSSIPQLVQRNEHATTARRCAAAAHRAPQAVRRRVTQSTDVAILIPLSGSSDRFGARDLVEARREDRDVWLKLADPPVIDQEEGA